MELEDEKPQKVSFIPCLTWVRRGVANPTLEKVKPSKEELQDIIKELRLREAEYKSRPKKDKEEGDEDSDENEENEEGRDVDDLYDMDNYDNEIVEPPGTTSDINMLLTAAQQDSDDEESLDSDEEPDEGTIHPDDNLILCGHVDGDVCMLEAYGWNRGLRPRYGFKNVFNNDKGELFIHNDVFLPSYPICIEWLDFNPKDADTPGHFAAVGCVTPEIGVWDLNVSGCLEPAFKLGSKKKKTARHTDAVLDLAWHQSNRSILASGSADNTVILWDMAKTASVIKIESFEEKVQSLKWHAFETQSLLTGCCDGKVRLYDCRNPKYFKTWGFEGEIERVMWNNFDPFYYFATTDKGMVHYVDIRNSKPVWNLKAHDKEVTGIAISSHCKDMLMTASMDEAVKVWDLQGGTPHFVTQKNMAIGAVYTLEACPDVPYVFCAGGSKKDNHLYVWDSRESDAVMERFKDRKFDDHLVSQKESTGQGMDVDGEEPQPSTSNSSQAGSSGRGMDGRIKPKKRKGGSKKIAAAAMQSSGPGKSKSKSKKDRKKLHPKTPKDPDQGNQS